MTTRKAKRTDSHKYFGVLREFAVCNVFAQRSPNAHYCRLRDATAAVARGLRYIFVSIDRAIGCFDRKKVNGGLKSQMLMEVSDRAIQHMEQSQHVELYSCCGSK